MIAVASGSVVIKRISELVAGFVYSKDSVIIKSLGRKKLKSSPLFFNNQDQKPKYPVD